MRRPAQPSLDPQASHLCLALARPPSPARVPAQPGQAQALGAQGGQEGLPRGQGHWGQRSGVGRVLKSQSCPRLHGQGPRPRPGSAWPGPARRSPCDDAQSPLKAEPDQAQTPASWTPDLGPPARPLGPWHPPLRPQAQNSPEALRGCSTQPWLQLPLLAPAGAAPGAHIEGTALGPLFTRTFWNPPWPHTKHGLAPELSHLQSPRVGLSDLWHAFWALIDELIPK